MEPNFINPITKQTFVIRQYRSKIVDGEVQYFDTNWKWLVDEVEGEDGTIFTVPLEKLGEITKSSIFTDTINRY